MEGETRKSWNGTFRGDIQEIRSKISVLKTKGFFAAEIRCIMTA
jgi:hypothetical protein